MKNLRYFLSLCCLVALTVHAQVNYLERSWDSEKKQVVTVTRTCNSYKEITGENSSREGFNSGWYVVKGNVERFQFYFKGEVHLILTDGCRMRTKQVVVQKRDNTKLYIYSQSDGENQGKLEACNDYFDLNAALGSVESDGMGSLYIHGGNISATQLKSSSAAIGGGFKGQIDPQSEIVIYGGKVTAKSDQWSAAIGGGYVRDQGGPITIYGGTVDATGGPSGAAIGGGHGSKGGKVNIYGGKVTARGSDSNYASAGIGGAEGGDVHIYGGEVYAYGGRGAAGIGGSHSGKGGTLEVTGGLVFASCNEHDEWLAPAIGGGMYGDGGKVTITGGTVMAVTRQSNTVAPAPIGAGSYKGGHLFYSKGELYIGDNMMVSYSTHQEAIKDPKYREGIYLHAANTAQREDACTDHSYTFVRIEGCSHPNFTYVYKDEEKHVRQCTLCNYKVEETHTYKDGQACVCGKMNKDYSDYWTVTYYYSKDGKTYEKGEEYQVIKGMDISLPAPPKTEGLTFKGYLPQLTNIPSDIEMKDSEQEKGELLARGMTFSPTMNVSYYARYRYNFKENWEWNDDYTAAKVTLTNSMTGETVNLNATISEDIKSRIEPTEESLGETHYTAVATYQKAQGVTYHFEDIQKVILYQPRIVILDAFASDEENTAILEKYNGFKAEVTINNLALKKDGKLHSICLPFSVTDLKDTPLEGATLYRYSGYSIANTQMNILFERNTGIEAGRPYFYQFKNDGTTVTHPTFPLVLIEDTDGGGNYELDFDLQGTYEAVGFTDENRDKIAVLEGNEIIHQGGPVDGFSCFFSIFPSFDQYGCRTVCSLSLEFDRDAGLVFTKKLYDSWSGDGSEASPYNIRSAQQLKELQEDFNGTDATRLKGKYFKQGADITFDSSLTNNFTPIKNFSAHYDGAGFTISGMKMSLTNHQDAALFDIIDEGASVKNVIIRNSSFKGYSAAAIATSVFGGSHVENCHVLRDVTIEAETAAGGVIAFINNNASLVTGCSSHATVKGYSGVGGVVGSLTNGVVSNCIYLGNSITASVDYNAVLGYRQNGKVENCFFTNPTLNDSRAKLMPMEREDNTNFLKLLHDRDTYLMEHGMTEEQIYYDLTMNGRTFAATQQTDGTWKSKAYTVSLPFTMRLEQLENFENIKVYKLHEVDLDNKVLQFTNDFPVLMAGEPYVVVIEKGSFSFSAKNVLVKEEPLEPQEVKNADATKQMGWWATSFKTLDNDRLIEENAYILQKDGMIKCVSKKYSNVTFIPFRSYFSALEPLTVKDFFVRYIPTENGVETGNVTDFPADEFDSDGDLSDETDILSIPLDPQYDSHYYDLQGRPLNNKPNKGIYIHHGRKYIYK